MASAAALAAERPAASPWILDPGRDLLLFVATPLLLIPIIWAAGRVWPPESLYAAAMFGALGHHLPGMMRAYGDRELFARFRTRFVLAPLFLVAICVTSAWLDPTMTAIVLMTYLWGVWHGLMQTHGFLRIYDAKVGSTRPWTARLDQAMCIAWFGAGVIWSRGAMYKIGTEVAMAGGPALSARFLHDLRVVWGFAAVAVTLAYVVYTVLGWRAGRRPNPVKLILLGTSCSFWVYANNIVPNLLVGILLFELFHDIQYLSIVWVFNRKRVASGSRVDTFTRFMFRNRLPLLVLYVGCVFAYGALRLVPALPSAKAQQIFTAVLAASALLHFYYDSFIWKVKERGTRAGLGLAGGAAEPSPAVPLGATALTAMRWCFLVLPLVYLGVSFSRAAVPPEAKMTALGATFPGHALAQHNLSVALAAAGDMDGAISATRRALALEKFDRGLIAEANANLVHFLVDGAKQRLEHNRSDLATPLLREAASLDPQVADALRSKGLELSRAGDARGAAIATQAAQLAVAR